MQHTPKKNDTSVSLTPNNDSHRLLTRYSGWFHPHKSWKCIFFEYILSWFLRLDKLALACQQIMTSTATEDDEEGDADKDNSSSLENQTAATPTPPTTRMTKKAMELMTLENAKVRNRMEDKASRSPAMLDKALTQWSMAATCPIVDYDLYVPTCPRLLVEWGIIDDIDIALEEEEHMIPKKQDDILVKVRFPACLLDDDDDDSAAAAMITTTTMDQQDKENEKKKKKMSTGDHHVLRPTAGSLDLAQLLQQQHSQHVPIVLHFHGGGLVMGSANDTVGIDLMRGVCSEIMKTSAAAATNTTTSPDSSSKKKKKNAIILLDIEYSLAPEHAFPIAIVQGLTVLQYILQDLNCHENNKIHITGISAGGLLCAVTTLHGMRRFPNRITSSIILCPMLDPSCQSDSYIRNETSSWLVPTAWLQWCWQVYLYQPDDENNNTVKQQEEMPLLELAATASTTDTTATTITAADTTLRVDESDDKRKEQQQESQSSSSCCSAWWQQHKNNSQLAPLMSPLWDDFQDLVDVKKKKKNHSSSSSQEEPTSSSSSSSWPRFLITTNRGDPLHDEGVALVQKLRAATIVGGGGGGGDNNNDDKQQDDNNSCPGTAVQVQHLDHDGTHWFGTFLDTPSYQELIHACKDILFPSGTLSD